jgi:hypothetical protein
MREKENNRLQMQKKSQCFHPMKGAKNQKLSKRLIKPANKTTHVKNRDDATACLTATRSRPQRVLEMRPTICKNHQPPRFKPSSLSANRNRNW